MKIKKFLPILILFCAALFSCTKNNSLNADINVTASTFPCYDAARAILGNTLTNGISNLKLLVKPGTEVHSYDPSATDIIDIQKSDLFIYVGGESDEWVKRVINFPVNELKLIEHVQTLDEVIFEENHKDYHFHEHEHEHFEIENLSHFHEQEFGEIHKFNENDDLTLKETQANSQNFEFSKNQINPHEQDEHIWTSPANEIKIVLEICDYLCKIANEKNKTELSEQFQENAKNYIQQIQKVSEQTFKILDQKQERFILMADRFPFTYFANYYNLKYDAAFSGCSTAVEASAATISRLIDTVKSKDLPAVFYIELGNHKIADTIAQSCNVKAYCLQSCQNVTKKDFESGCTWVSLMEQNAKTLQEGLK